MLIGCSEHIVQQNETDMSGTISLDLELNKVGMARSSAVNLNRIDLELIPPANATSKLPIHQTIRVSGNNHTLVQPWFKKLEAPLTYELIIKSYDDNNVVIHEGSETLVVEQGDTTEASVVLHPKYSMFGINIGPVPQHMYDLRLYIDDSLVLRHHKFLLLSEYESYTDPNLVWKHNDSINTDTIDGIPHSSADSAGWKATGSKKIMLISDYVSEPEIKYYTNYLEAATGAGITHSIKLELNVVYANTYRHMYLLDSGIDVISSEDQSFAFWLKNVAPKYGVAHLKMDFIKVGSSTIDVNLLEDNL